MKTIYQAKEFIKSKFGKTVIIKILGIRNKIELLEGVISECYNHIFIVKCNYGNRSFTYTDVLVGNIIVNVK